MSSRPRGNGGAMYQQGNTQRQNEYFVPRDGITREVITADICRYLGNDALVRPGTHADDNGRVIQGYFITAYRNLTSAMIDDLKTDSSRWEAERRNSGAVRYQDSHIRDGPQRPIGGGAAYGMQPEYGAPPREYDSGARYPGSGAPGYSGSSYSTAGSVGGYISGQYPQGLPPQPQYAPVTQAGIPDTRYGGPPPTAGPVPGYGAASAQLAPEGYTSGSHYTVASTRDMYSVDMAMTDAPAAPIRRTSPPVIPTTFAPNPVSSVRTSYGSVPAVAPPAYGGFGQPAPAPGTAYSQPVDNNYGRAPTVPSSGYNPAHDMQSQPAQQYEDPAFPSSPSRSGPVAASAQAQLPTPNSASATGPRRDHRDRPVSDRPDHRDRDRHDRIPDRERERERDITPPNRTGSANKSAASAHHHYGRR